MAVTPLHKVAKVKRMIVSTYQAASGAGAAAMEELREQTRDVLEGKEAKPVIFPYQVLASETCPAAAAAAAAAALLSIGRLVRQAHVHSLGRSAQRDEEHMCLYRVQLLVQVQRVLSVFNRRCRTY